MRQVFRHPKFQTGLAKLVGLYLVLALRTVRWTFVGEEHLAGLPTRSAVIFSAWHEDLPMMPALWARLQRMPGGNQRRIALLISKSRDGRMIAEIMRRFGALTTAGSSSNGGRAALRSLLDTLQRGDHIGITPDGPRGPRRQANAGVAQLAALSGAPVLPCAAHMAFGWTLGSWDRMQLPMPFGQGVIVCGSPIFVAREGWREAADAVASALTDAADRALALTHAHKGSVTV
jgi:lysophospholipid acyltransferase (LPLAT)-like uncharacterized protein